MNHPDSRGICLLWCRGASPMALELSIRVKTLVAKLVKSFGIHTGHAESLGDFRYKSRAIGHWSARDAVTRG